MYILGIYNNFTGTALKPILLNIFNVKEKDFQHPMNICDKGAFTKHVASKEGIVMFRSCNFRSSGGLGPVPFGPRAGRSFLHRSSGFFSVFLRHVKDHKSLKK